MKSLNNSAKIGKILYVIFSYRIIVMFNYSPEVYH